MNEWQNIESAPDDDVLILGWWATFLGVRSWECEIEHYDREFGDHCATHWMPLPDPPEQQP